MVAWRSLQGREVEVATVTSRPLKQTVVVSGRVLAPAKTDIGATITGRVHAVKVDEGGRVAAGQAPTFGAMSASREFQQADVLLADVKALNRAALDELRARFHPWPTAARIDGTASRSAMIEATLVHLHRALIRLGQSTSG